MLTGGQDWFVLTTAASNTLPLAASLIASGFEVWTPRFTQARRRPRSRSRTTRSIPLTPTYVFARHRHLPEIIELTARLDFSILRCDDTIPLIADAALEPLRTAETAVIPKRQQRSWTKGEKVRIPEGIFAGMIGLVESSARGLTIVAFGNVPVEFPSSHLRADGALAA